MGRIDLRRKHTPRNLMSPAEALAECGIRTKAARV
jgi:hypothetical protein